MLSGAAALQHYIRVVVVMHFVDAENDLPSIFYGYYCCCGIFSTNIMLFMEM